MRFPSLRNRLAPSDPAAPVGHVHAFRIVSKLKRVSNGSVGVLTVCACGKRRVDRVSPRFRPSQGAGK